MPYLYISINWSANSNFYSPVFLLKLLFFSIFKDIKCSSLDSSISYKWFSCRATSSLIPAPHLFCLATSVPKKMDVNLPKVINTQYTWSLKASPPFLVQVWQNSPFCCPALLFAFFIFILKCPMLWYNIAVLWVRSQYFTATPWDCPSESQEHTEAEVKPCPPHTLSYRMMKAFRMDRTSRGHLVQPYEYLHTTVSLGLLLQTAV